MSGFAQGCLHNWIVAFFLQSVEWAGASYFGALPGGKENCPVLAALWRLPQKDGVEFLQSSAERRFDLLCCSPNFPAGEGETGLLPAPNRQNQPPVR